LNDLSKRRLEKVHPLLVQVVVAAAEDAAFLVVWGARSKEEQDKAVETGHSKLEWPKSKHNIYERRPMAEAVDLVPLRTDGTLVWEDIGAFRRLASVIKASADKLGIPIVWGGDWKKFPDWGHFELADERRAGPGF
jgi:peptidoglycan L-alanyl-D-glutamate endopeptidase CwlK